MIVLKLGGSVVTDKDRPETVDGDALDRAADAIAAAIDRDDLDRSNGTGGDQTPLSDGLVIVHGGGSFGHHNASDHGVSTTEGSHDVGAVIDIHGAMKTLNSFVLSRLHDRDVPAVPIHPFSAGHRDQNGRLALPSGQVETLLAEGFVPVLHGDVIAHATAGVTIVSGDELVASLARDLDADRIGLCSTVPGVLGDDDAVIDRIGAYEDVESVLGGSESTDVTGGMAGKVRALLDLDASSSIFGLADLDAFLDGANPGTTIE